jgi:hypothetical protein
MAGVRGAGAARGTAMICTTVLLAAAIGGLPSGACVLECEIRNAWVGITSSDGREGRIRDEHGWFEVQDIGDGRWLWVAEQEPEQCIKEENAK